MKSILQFLFLLLTVILSTVYGIGLSEKIQRPAFKNLPYSDYAWLGLMLVLMIYLNIRWTFLGGRNINRGNNDSKSQNPKRERQ